VSLERFRKAQNSSQSGYAAALGEVHRGRKQGHWIWYVFPQLDGLGTSPLAQTFAIDGETEAEAFLRADDLRSRLIVITQAVAEQLAGRPARSLRDLMGSDLDARKLVSSLTLFGNVARALYEADGFEACRAMASAADEVLAVAAAQGYPPCAYTLRRLGG
jgi:uncharacterized protein (DUF1810 family)